MAGETETRIEAVATRPRGGTRPRGARLSIGLAVLVTGVLTGACGELIVTPLSPDGTPSPPPRVPITLNIRGTLADGGTFTGFVTYGTEDLDAREDVGRYRGGFWDMVVTGGTSSKDVHFSTALGGRVLVETTRLPMPAIGVIFLWPEAEPAVQVLTPHFQARPGYDPDLQPSLSDFGALIPGSIAGRFSVFEDGQGGQVLLADGTIR